MLKLFYEIFIQKIFKKTPNSQLTELPHLAAELWEQIFLRVPRGHLRKLRQTCHYWRNIVDGSPALRDRLHVKFPHYYQYFFENYDPSLIPPVGRFSFESESFSVISDVSSWWPKVGEFLTVLCLGRCEFPLGLLRHTPNLKKLQLFYVKLVEIDNPDFKLHKVEELTVEYVDPDILIVLGEVITNVKSFSINGLVMDASEEADEERKELKDVIELLDIMDSKIPSWYPELKKSFHRLKLVTMNPRLYGETIFFTDPRIVRNPRSVPKHEELDMIRGFRDISEEELTAFVLRYPGLKKLMIVNCEEVAWMHFEQSAILTVHNHVITRNPRISVTHDKHDKHKTWFLHISNVQEEDKGRYMCQINTVTAKTQFGYLHVVDAMEPKERALANVFDDGNCGALIDAPDSFRRV
ncbi:conserved hypothetical protein [Culex quinquefasciatus]|uniref:F-box domain-containing protein n=1 Tax=Culex quinquefasciatus TaxID=7176 RepID=B0X569_CULQU|nr:conserved hypothetical protein [Culex quinquefasciatus]|eukprot:XP_001864791.1 conserved hypothetical protein [Culex quinquefasciatus]